MKVGVYSPLPPSPTGVADYAATLSRELRTHGLVESEPETCDIGLYHIGNNRLHATQYERALQHPGVVVLHDALLHHFYLGSFRKNRYIEEFVYNYGEFARQEAETLWRDRANSAQDPRFFSRPMLRRIASTARAVVVHNPAAARTVREHAPHATIVEIPHFQQSEAAPSLRRISEFRSRLHIPENGFVFAIFGYLRETKRLIPILQAFSELRRLQRRAHLLIAGQFVSQDLERLAAGFLSQPGVHRLPHLSPADLNLAAASIDCCLNLRYPTAGETSGIAMRLMSAAKPVVVTEGEEWARIPELALFRISPGPAEQEALFNTIVVLQLRPELANVMGQHAADHIQRYHSLSGSGEQYWNLLCRTHASSH